MKQLLSLGAALLSLGCSDAGPRVYTAQLYDPDAQCLGEYEAIGLVQADELSAACAAACLELPNGLFVSTVCPPYPDTATPLITAESADCAAALVAEPCE